MEINSVSTQKPNSNSKDNSKFISKGKHVNIDENDPMSQYDSLKQISRLPLEIENIKSPKSI